MSNFLKETITLETHIHFGKNASKELLSLKRVFQELGLVHQDYIDSQNHKDHPYWYGERTHVGFLAVAVWRSGGTALEEYGTFKLGENGDARGRCDLHITTKNHHSFDCEAKRPWLNLIEKSDLSDFFYNLKDADDDVKKLKTEQGLALYFVSLAYEAKKSKQDLKSARNRFQVFLQEEIKKLEAGTSTFGALVWINMAQGANLLQSEDKQFKYLGMLLAIKKIKKAD